MTVWKQSNKRPSDLEPLPLNPAAEHLWGWFKWISTTRQAGMAENPVTFAEIRHFLSLMGEAAEPWEIKALIQLDALRSNLLAEK